MANALVKKKPLVPTAEEDFAADTPKGVSPQEVRGWDGEASKGHVTTGLPAQAFIGLLQDPGLTTAVQVPR